MKHPLEFEAFVEWLGTKPPEEGYLWPHPERCAIGQWLRSFGWPEDKIGSKSRELTSHDGRETPRIRRLFVCTALRSPYTFGDAYKRGKELLGAE